MKALESKTALVTGSTQGIGLAIAERFAKEGARVVLNGRHTDDEKTRQAVQAAQTAGGSADAIHYIAADLSNTADAQRLVRDAIAHFGQLDILVNNAGVETRAAFEDVTEADYDRVLELNLKGIFFTTQTFVQHLRSTKRSGKIINISSVHEEVAFPHFAAYCASKGGLKMLMRDLAVELGPEGITVNNIAPGAIETPINTALLHDEAKLASLRANIPLGRLGKPEDVAAAALFLASADADYVTGASLVVDGGLMRNYHEQ